MPTPGLPDGTAAIRQMLTRLGKETENQGLGPAFYSFKR